MHANEQKLRDFAATAWPRQITDIVPGKVYHVMGYGHSNATFVIGNASVLLIDTLDSDARGAQLRELIGTYTSLPIRTIIYTHGHPDHRGGAGSLLADDPEIIAFSAVQPPLGRTQILGDILTARGGRQFGYHLNNDQVISQGLGPREGTTNSEYYTFVPPTTLYTESHMHRIIDGIEIELVAAPGETEDTIFVWLPQYGVLCCGDNYYACWPNLSAIRGHQYRDVDRWITSLDSMLAMNAAALLPGHFSPIVGAEAVRERLSRYREALDFVLHETLRLMNAGQSPREIVEQLKLPAHLRDLDFLQEFYGTIEWSIYGIFSGYLGWFDGNPTNLHPLTDQDRAERTISAMGGTDTVTGLVNTALADGEYQWAMELCDHLLAIHPANESAKNQKRLALIGAASFEISACGRNYYLSVAEELATTEA